MNNLLFLFNSTFRFKELIFNTLRIIFFCYNTNNINTITIKVVSSFLLSFTIPFLPSIISSSLPPFFQPYVTTTIINCSLLFCNKYCIVWICKSLLMHATRREGTLGPFICEIVTSKFHFCCIFIWWIFSLNMNIHKFTEKNVCYTFVAFNRGKIVAKRRNFDTNISRLKIPCFARQNLWLICKEIGTINFVKFSHEIVTIYFVVIYHKMSWLLSWKFIAN